MTASTFTAAAELASAVIDRAEFARALPIVLEAAAKRSSVPVLSMFRLTADGFGAAVTASDLDMEIRVRLPGAVDSRMDMCLDAHQFAALLKKAPKSDMVALTMPDFETANPVSPAVCSADFERIAFKLPALSGEAFPTLELNLDNAHRFTMTGAAFRDALEAVEGAISTEETRYYLNGVYFHSYQGELVTVATDGHRLYRQRLALPDGAEGMPGVIVPKGMVATLLKLTKGKACPAEVALAVTDSRIVVSFGDVEIRSKVIDGTFPDYNRVIPTRNDNVATLDSAALVEGVNGVSLIASDRGRAVKLVFGDEIVTLHVRNGEGGEARMDVATSFEGEPMEIGVNARYLTEVAESFKGEIRMAMANCGSPICFTGTREGFDAVLMPVRI